MFPMTAVELLKITGGTIVNGSRETKINRISLDSRNLCKGDLFIPIQGSNHDGHNFIAQALHGGAIGFLSNRWDEKLKKSLADGFGNSTLAIVVEDTLQALQAIAKHIRDKLDVEVIGITGSTGKTCTKDMIASVLAQARNVVSTEKNYNNEIGVPLTILKANESTEILVVEMAMRGVGQIRQLAEIVQPTMGLVTNVGKTHFELLGSEEKIADAKSELVEAIPSEGMVILNADDKWTEKLRRLSSAPVVTYGVSESAEFKAVDIQTDAEGRPSFRIVTDSNELSLSLPFPGRHNVYNALAACAVASEIHISQARIKRGLETCAISEMRMQVFNTPDGVIIINDAYNASPTSMKAALETLSDLAGKKRKIAVLGDMLELGTLSEMAHFKIGELVSDSKVDILITVGEKSKRIAVGAMSKGMSLRQVIQCEKTLEASAVLADQVKPGDVVLIKASRGMELEKAVDALIA